MGDSDPPTFQVLLNGTAAKTRTAKLADERTVWLGLAPSRLRIATFDATIDPNPLFCLGLWLTRIGIPACEHCWGDARQAFVKQAQAVGASKVGRG